MTGHERSASAESAPGSSDRLDSWKAIADFLGRSVRTARRWERTLGLPVRRLPGAERHSVFAYRREIEDWLSRTPERERVVPGAEGDGFRWPSVRVVAIGLLAMAVAVVAAVVFTTRSARPGAATIHVTTDSSGVTAYFGNHVLWTWPYPAVADARMSGFERDLSPMAAVSALGDSRWEVTAVTPAWERGATHEWIGSDLVRLGADGRPRWQHTPGDTVRFGGRLYAAPWQLSRWAIEPSGSQRIAAAWRHMVWSPALVKVLSIDGRAESVFVNPGWILSVVWMTGDRRSLVLTGGVSNALDAGFMAAIDPRDGDTTAPEGGSREFACADCPKAHPLWYAAFPRSELNLMTGSGMNAAGVTHLPGQILVRTLEVSAQPTGAEAIYEFSDQFEFRHASFGPKYWEVHRQLEAAGTLTHSRARCPDRDGPRQVRLWSAATGWTVVSPHGTVPPR